MKGKHISLRAPEPADIDCIYNWENDISVWHVSGTTKPYSRYDIEQYVLNTHHDIYAAKQLRLMISLHNHPSEPIGAIDLFDFDPLNHRAGVGILMTSHERGKGYATEALSLLCDYCFNTLNLHQLFCHISPDNKVSIQLFTRAGFVTTGICKEWTLSGNVWHDACFMQLIKG
ncbi:MAG: GNAT family N-acetyltransferase [Bacteroidales bacterium]|nr:GNAT family N-acetyltransferase [Bacteroidales bacterium]